VAVRGSHTVSREFREQPDPVQSTLCKTKSRLPCCKLKLQPHRRKTRNSVFSNYTPNALHITKHDKPSHVSPVTVDLRPRVDTQTKPNAHILHTNDKQTKRIVELNRAMFTRQSAAYPSCRAAIDKRIITYQHSNAEVQKWGSAWTSMT
jgi:hypothetical protein